MAYNRYRGNTGRVIRVPDPEDFPPPSPLWQPEPEPETPPPRQPEAEHRENRDAGDQKPHREERRQVPKAAPAQPAPREQRREPPAPRPRPEHRPPDREEEKGPPGLLAGWGESIGGLLGKLKLQELESEDLLLLLILYFLYRESGDKELLLIMGAMYLL